MNEQNNNNIGSSNPQMPQKQNKDQKVVQSGKDLGQMGLKAAGNAIGGPVGGMVANKIANSKLGQNALNRVGQNMAKNPMMNNALSKASPGLQKAKPAMNATGGGLGGSKNSSMGLGPKTGGNSNDSSQETTTDNKKDSGSSNKSTSSQSNNGSSNSGFGNNKSGLFSNPFKLGGDAKGESSKNPLATFKKTKKVIGIVAAVAPIVFPIIMGILVIIIVMAQIMTVRDQIQQLARQFTTGVEKLVNFAQGDGWMTNEDSFFNYLDKEYNKFSSTVNSGSAQLDIPLIAATIHYSKVGDLEQYEETEADYSDYSEEDFSVLGSALTKDNTASFYKIAKDKLGSVNTLWPGQKRLLGHIVKTEVSVEWIDIDAAGSYWSSFFSYFNQTIASTVDDAYWNTPIKYGNVVTAIPAFIDTYSKAKAYYDANGNIFGELTYDGMNLWYEAGEFINTFAQLFNDSSGLSKNENGSIVGKEDQNGILKFPCPVLKRTMNYGYSEFKEMKKIVTEMRAIIKDNTLTDDALYKQAKNSSDEKLQALAKDYETNKNKYLYSYTHYLKEVYIPFTYFYKKNYTDGEINSIIDEIYDQRDLYNYLIGEDFNQSCGGSCVYNVNGKQVSNLKVRLMQCGSGRGKPIEGEELVDFEKYILGVVYAEIGPDAPKEAAKAQAIAARSYSLTRPKAMGNSAGLKLEEENGQWILSIRNCTEDQVYCDPDKGCSNTTSPSSSGNSTTVYSGANTKPYTYKGPLATDATIRAAVSEVSGEVLLDANGNIINSGYVNSNQQKWASQAKSGMDYTEILMAEYTNTTTISKSNCSNVCNAATGDYTQWKQFGQSWSNISIGSSTIGKIGCLATSVSIQLARSGVPVSVAELNPGTFVEAIKPEGFQGNNFVWSAPSKIAPTFVYQGKYSLSGTQAQKAATVQNYINNGCYLVMEVKTSCGKGQHWVAVDYVEGSTVHIMDPGSSNGTTWDTYGAQCAGTLACYKVIG